MPPAVLVVAAAVVAGGGAAIAGATLIASLVIGASVLAFGFISNALTPKLKEPSFGNFAAEARDRQVTFRSPIAPHQIIYGETQVSGPLLAPPFTTGLTNEFLHLVVGLAGHEVESIGDVFIDDTLSTDARFSGLIRVNKHLGSDTQVADTDLVAEVTEWTTAHRLRGIAYVYIRLKWDADVWTGEPNIRAKVKGRKVWDPRLNPGDPSVTAFSQNAALCQLDYAMAPFSVEVALSEIDESAAIAAANICDQAVPLAAGGNQNRYELDGAFTLDRKPGEVMEEMLTASAGTLIPVQGKYRLYAGAFDTPTITLDDDDLRGPISFTTKPSRRALFNAVRGLFVDKLNFFQANDFPVVTNATYETEDGGNRIFADIELKFTTDAIRAQRLAKITLERARQAIVLKFPAKLVALEVAGWDTVMITISHVGFSSKVFRVLERALNIDGGIDLSLQEEASTAYDWTTEETVLDPAPNTTLPSVFNPEQPASLLLLSGIGFLFVTAAGDIVHRIKASWTALTDQFVTSGGSLEVQFKKNADADWISYRTIAGDRDFLFIDPLEAGVAYDVRVRSINVSGFKSAFTSVLNHTVGGKTTAPADVGQFTATQNGFVVNFKWPQVADKDLAGYVIRIGPRTDPDLSYANATPLTEVTKGTAITNAHVPAGDWRFFLKAVDTSGNESTNALTADLVVVNFNDTITQNDQEPDWIGVLISRGTTVGFVRHQIIKDDGTFKGILIPDSQDGAAGDNFDLFDNFVVNPVVNCIYESEEFDIGFDDTVRAWGSIDSALGPGVTSGLADPELQLDFRLDSGSYGGFKPWIPGNFKGRFAKFRLVLDTSIGLAKVTSFIPTIDLLERAAGEKDLVIAAGGTAITFADPFHFVPRLVVAINSSSALIPTFSVPTKTGFTAHIFNTSGTQVGGSGYSYDARGI